MNKSKIFAVITGDIVGSGKLAKDDRAKLYADFKKFLASLKKEGYIRTFEMFRGDSMQCLVKQETDALRVALIIRAWYKSYGIMPPRSKRKPSQTASEKGYYSGNHDIRLSVGIGTVEFLNVRALGQSDGQAFLLSGQGLDGLKGSAEKLIVSAGDEKFTEAIAPAIGLLDAVLEKWTGNQAEIVLYKLKNLKEEEIAQKIGISQSAVNQRTKNSRWNAIESFISWFEKTVKDRTS